VTDSLSTRTEETGPIEVLPPIRAKTWIHPWSALILIGIDALWGLGDWVAASWALTIPLSFLTAAIPIYRIQRQKNEDSSQKALCWAVFLGILAAIPTPIMGTIFGGLILTWSGLGFLRKRK
jgi:hypothetical protein